MITLDRPTEITRDWIVENGYGKSFSLAHDVNHLKRFVMTKLYGNARPTERFIRGAKLVNWHYIFDQLKKTYENI